MERENNYHAPHGAQNDNDDFWTDLAEIPDDAYQDEDPDADRRRDQPEDQ